MSELEIWNELGNLYYNTGAYDEAVRAYNKAIELDHGCGQSYSNLASIYLHKERYAEAIPLLQKGIELLGEKAEQALLWNRLGDTWLHLDDYANAVAAYRTAVELDPENTVLRENLARAESDSAHSAPEAGTQTKGLPDTQPLSPDSIPAVPNPAEAAPAPDLPEASEGSAPPAACWVFKTDQPAASGEAGSYPEPSPVLLGRHILSEPTIEEQGTSTPEQAGEPANPEMSAAAPAAAPETVAGEGRPTDTSADLTADQTRADPVPSAPEQTVAELTGNANSSNDQAGSSLNGNDQTSPTSQALMGAATGGRAEALLQMGKESCLKGECGRASRFLHAALAIAADLYDNQLEAHCYEAIARLETELGKTDQAIQAYENAVSLASEEIFPWNDLGRLYSNLDRHEDAISAYQKAIEQDPKDPISWNGLGDVYHKLGRNDDAIAAYQLGNVFDKQSRQEDGRPKAETTSDSGRLQAEKWKEIGNVHFDIGEDEEAIRAYQTAIELLVDSPAKAALWDRLGEIYQRLGNEAQAAEAYHNAAALDPDNTVPNDDLSEAEPDSTPALAGETAGGAEAEALSAAGREDPSSAESSGEEPAPIIVEEAAGEPEAAYWVFEPNPPLRKIPHPATQFNPPASETTVASLKPSSSLPLSPFSGQVNLDDQALAGASPETAVEVDLEGTAGTAVPEMDMVEAPTITLENHPSHPGQTDFRVLENDIAAYRRVTEINPKNDRAWDALGNMYEAVGLHSEAIEAFEKAISLDPRKEVYYYHLGLAHASQLHYDKAIQALRKVIKLNPEYMLAHCALASSYRRIGKEAEAKHHIAIARPSVEKENEYNQACFESISGNVERSIAFLKIALEKQQIQLEWVRNDPDLDFIRTDPRFEALVRKEGNPGR